MKNFERLMNFFTGRGTFIFITTAILFVVALRFVGGCAGIHSICISCRVFCWCCNTYCTINGIYQLPVLGNTAI